MRHPYRSKPDGPLHVARFTCDHCRSRRFNVALQVLVVLSAWALLYALSLVNAKWNESGDACRDGAINRFGSENFVACPHPQHSMILNEKGDYACFCDSFAGAAVRGGLFEKVSARTENMR